MDASGNFSVSFPISSAYPPGTYYACVGSVNVTNFCGYGNIGIKFSVLSASTSSGSGSGSGSSQPTAVIVTPVATPPASLSTTATTTPIAGPPAVFHGAPPTTPTTGSHTVPWWLVVAGIVAVLAVLGALAAVVLRRVRPGRSTSGA